MNYEKLQHCLMDYDDSGLLEEIDALLGQGAIAEEIIENGLLVAMEEVGRQFKNNELFIPEVLMIASVMNEGLDKLKPLLQGGETKNKGVIAIGTVKGDLHDIGKNLVAMFLEMDGFKVIDLGNDAPVEKFIDTMKNEKVDILACSALLTTTMEVMRDLVNELNAQDLRDNVKVVVGGAPVTQQFSDMISADGFANDASSAVELCNALLAS